MENKYLIFDEVNDIYDIDKKALFTFLLSQGFDKDITKQWLEDNEFVESVINSFDDLEEATEDDIEEWAITEMEFYSEGNDFLKEDKMNEELLRMQMLSGIITESEYKAKLEELNNPKEKKSLNENFVGMGMVGNIFDREKTDYEMAFEHFLGSKYNLNEEVESSDMIDFVKQNFDKIKTNFYNAEKEAIMNDDYADQSDIDNLKAQLMDVSTAGELIDVINNRSIGVDLEGEEASELFDMIKGYASLEEGKEVEEPSLYEDVVKGKNIKKVDGKWRVLSGKSGKMWPQTYDSKKDAEDAIKAYHANK